MKPRSPNDPNDPEGQDLSRHPFRSPPPEWRTSILQNAQSQAGPSVAVRRPERLLWWHRLVKTWGGEWSWIAGLWAVSLGTVIIVSPAADPSEGKPGPGRSETIAELRDRQARWLELASYPDSDLVPPPPPPHPQLAPRPHSSTRHFSGSTRG